MEKQFSSARPFSVFLSPKSLTMKKTLRPFCLLSAMILFCNLSAQVQHFTWQGVEREYIVHTPANHSGTLPVLFFLHGLGDNCAHFAQEYNASQMAEDFGWAIVVPQARNLGMGNMWNVEMTNSNVDDVGFLLALLDSLTIQEQLDPDSVFFTGFSMGGFMTYRMAIEHGNRITACAPVSGLIATAQSMLTPVSPVRMLHIHGTNDGVVCYDGGSYFFNMTLGLGVDAIMDYWQNANACSGTPTIDTLPDLQNDGLRFIRYTYDCGTDLQLLKVVGGDHTWYDNVNQYDVDYKNVIYEFFTGNSASSSISELEIGRLRVWPNPTGGILNIQTLDSQSSNPVVRVYDVYGKIVDMESVRMSSRQIDLSALPDGVYFVKTSDGAVSKVVKRF